MYDTQKADFDQLATDAGDMKAAYDTQKADFDSLQVRPAVAEGPDVPCFLPCLGVTTGCCRWALQS
jgi:hypothetical protein